MFGGLEALTHGLPVLVEAFLDGLQHMLMLPARDAPLLACCAARLERTVTAGIGPITPQLLAALLVGVVVVQPFADRTAIHIFIADIDEVCLPKRPIASMPEFIGLGSATAVR